MAQKPPKTQKPTHNPYLTQSLEQATAGKIYLVRDKDHGDGKPTVWGKELPHADAHKLKEALAATGKSRTVRFEEQLPDNPYAHLPIDERSPYYQAEPEVHPDILAAQAAGRAAVAPLVQAANNRQAQTKAAPVAPPTPLPMPELPPELEGDDLPELSQDDLDKLLGPTELGTPEDHKAAAAEVKPNAPAPVNLLDLARKEACPHVYADGKTCGAQPGAPCTDPSGPITHPARIQAAAAKIQPANDPLMEAGHA